MARMVTLIRSHLMVEGCWGSPAAPRDKRRPALETTLHFVSAADSSDTQLHSVNCAMFDAAWRHCIFSSTIDSAHAWVRSITSITGASRARLCVLVQRASHCCCRVDAHAVVDRGSQARRAGAHDGRDPQVVRQRAGQQLQQLVEVREGMQPCRGGKHAVKECISARSPEYSMHAALQQQKVVVNSI